MTKIERFLRMAQTTSQLKKLRWEGEDRARERELFSTLPPELKRAHALKQSGLDWKTALELSKYVPPEEKGRREMTGELAHLKSVHGAGILKHIAERPETPPETKRKMIGLRETFPSIETGYEEPRLTAPEAERELRIRKKLTAGVEVGDTEKQWEVSRQDAMSFLTQLGVSEEDMPAELPTIMRLGNAGYIASTWKPSETPLRWRRYMISQKFEDKDDIWTPRVTDPFTFWSPTGERTAPPPTGEIAPTDSDDIILRQQEEIRKLLEQSK